MMKSLFQRSCAEFTTKLRFNLTEQKWIYTFDIALPYGYSKRKTGVKTMSDTYFDLPSRLEDSFPEIDSDIVTDLRKTSEEYAEI